MVEFTLVITCHLSAFDAAIAAVEDVYATLPPDLRPKSLRIDMKDLPEIDVRALADQITEQMGERVRKLRERSQVVPESVEQ